MAIIILTAVPGFVEASENVRREILHNDSDPMQVAVPSGMLQHGRHGLKRSS